MRRRLVLSLSLVALGAAPMGAGAVVRTDATAARVVANGDDAFTAAVDRSDTATVRAMTVGKPDSDAAFANLAPVSGVRSIASSDPAATDAEPTTISRLPEPATWAMMVAGFGAAGYALRRRLRASERRFTERMRRIAAGEDA